MFSFTASASKIAVPLGASNFLLWCASTISISKPAALSVGAICAKTFDKVFIPKDIFAERSIAVVFESSLILSICFSLSPVVQMTAGIFFSSIKSKRLSTAFTEAKSITASASISIFLISSNTGNPKSTSVFKSTPATISTVGSKAISSLTTLPIAPFAPFNIILVIIIYHTPS